MKVVKTGIGILVMIGMAALYGCSAGQQTPAECFVLETAVCAAAHDPTTDRPGFAQCTAAAAQACGVVGPVPSPAPKAPFPTKMLDSYK